MFTLVIPITAAADSTFSGEFQELIFNNEHQEVLPLILLLSFAVLAQFIAIGISLS